MAFGVNRIFSVGKMGPDGIGEILKLDCSGPIWNATATVLVITQDFLEKKDISVDFSHGSSNLLQNEVRITNGKALMNIVRKYSYLHLEPIFKNKKESG